MAYTFLKARGENIGASKLEEDKIGIAKGLLEKAAAANVKIELPADHIVTDDINSGTNAKEVGVDIDDGWFGVDIGKKSVENFKAALKDAKTICWNGPVGIFEIPEFANGTKEVAEFIAALDATKVIGGGDTAAAINKLGLKDRMTHVSTGGGASLEFLEGKDLPGIAALNK